MPIFICDKCGVLENTACCSYWTLAMEQHSTSSRLEWSEELKEHKGKKYLCSECADIEHFRDGRSVVVPGKWHGRFKKEYPDSKSIYWMRKNKQILN